MKNIIGLFILTMTLFSGHANAQWATFDGANFVKNTLTSIAATKTEISTAASYVEQAKQTLMFAKQIKSMDGLKTITSLQSEMQKYQALQATDQQLLATLNRANTLGSNVNASIGASNGSSKAYFQNASKNQLDRANLMMQESQQVGDSINDTSQKRQQILNNLSASDGSIAASTQATTLAIDQVASQNQKLLGMMATNMRLAAQDKKDTVNDQANTINMWNAKQQDYQKSVAKFSNQ